MKADAHHHMASSLVRAIALARHDPTTSVAILENAWGAAYPWINYGCIQMFQQHRDKHQRLIAYLVGLREQLLAQWWRNVEDLRQTGFLRYTDHVVNSLRTITAAIPVNHREMACETHF